MYEELLSYAFPTLIVLAFVNFIWAWILTAVKPPYPPEEKSFLGDVNPDWKYLDAGPEGVRRTIAQRVKPKIKAG